MPRGFREAGFRIVQQHDDVLGAARREMAPTGLGVEQCGIER
jgi:hypothetical protein